MSKKLTGKALSKFEAKRDVWQEVLDGIREIKAGRGKQTKLEAKCARPLCMPHHIIVRTPFLP